MITDLQPDVSSYTIADLIVELAEFQLHADRLHMIAADLPDNAMRDAATQLYGFAADVMCELIQDVVDVPCADDRTFDRALNGVRAFMS